MARVFKAFRAYVCEGDFVERDYKGFTLRATIYRDDCRDAPDERQDGFWPSRNPDDAGYVLPKNYARERAKAHRVMNAWKNDEWWYCGVAVTVSKNGIELTGRYDHAVWGIEANYPISRGSNRNHYLRTVADELVSEALDAARVKIAALCNYEEEG